MKTYNVTLAANEIQYFAGGNSFHLITATSGIDVEYLKADLTNINETATDVESGYNVRYPSRIVEVFEQGRVVKRDLGGFDLVKITNGSTPQTVKFGIARDGEGDYNIGSSQITGGTIDEVSNVLSVDLVDDVTSLGGVRNDRILTAGVNMYSVGLYINNAAGLYSVFAIENPTGSGKQILIKSMRVSHNNSTGAGKTSMGWYSGSPSETDPTLTDLSILGDFYYANKYIGSPSGAAKVYSGNLASIGGTFNNIFYVQTDRLAIFDLIETDDPIVLTEGNHIKVYNTDVDTAFSIIVETEEI